MQRINPPHDHPQLRSDDATGLMMGDNSPNAAGYFEIIQGVNDHWH
jgi:hypothetical protein